MTPAHLVTSKNITSESDGGSRLPYDSDNRHRDIYRRIWMR